jgi:5'-phosphate synthase pdxT subunit
MGRKDIKIAVLAVQGAFIEHEKMLAKLGIKSFEIRQKKDLEQDFDGLILPVFGTCAGLILLADNLSNDDNKYFGTLPVTVKRNAYGRQ